MHKMRGREGEKGRDKLTYRERERERLDVFSASLHFSLAPRGFSKAFSKKTNGSMMDQTPAAATSQPTQHTAGFDISVTISPCVVSVSYSTG